MKLPGFKDNRDSVVGRLLALCDGESGEDVLAEALGVLAVAYGEGSVVSIVRISDRKVLATSEGRQGSSLSAMVGTIDFIDKKIRHVRGERTSLAFREGIGCVTVRPLVYGRKAKFSAVVETRGAVKDLPGRPFDVLAMMAGLDEAANAREGVRLRGRESAEADAAENGGCVAVVGTAERLLMDVDKLEGLARKVSEVISPLCDAYRIGECRFAFLTKGDEFEGTRVASLLIDECAGEGIDYLSAGVARVGGDARHALFLAEGAMMRAAVGEVVVERVTSECGNAGTGDARVVQGVTINADQKGGEGDGEEVESQTKKVDA